MQAGQNDVSRPGWARIESAGTALLLLVVAVASTTWAVLSERDESQRWVARDYFGRDGSERCADMQKELLEHHLVMVYKPMADEEFQHLLKTYPAPLAAPPPQPSLDPWDPMNDGFGGSR